MYKPILVMVNLYSVSGMNPQIDTPSGVEGWFKQK
jgi:hypothetical protein